MCLVGHTCGNSTLLWSVGKSITSSQFVWIFKYVLSTMGVSKESISKFLIGNRFHVKLRILSPYSNRICVDLCG